MLEPIYLSVSGPSLPAFAMADHPKCHIASWPKRTEHFTRQKMPVATDANPSCYLHAPSDVFLRQHVTPLFSSDVQLETMRTVDGKIENRAERRLKVFLRVEVGTGSHSHPAHLIDVSPHGAQVHCKEPIEANTFVVLQYQDISRRAKCVRSCSDRLGLRFIVPLLPTEMALFVRSR